MLEIHNHTSIKISVSEIKKTIKHLTKFFKLQLPHLEIIFLEADAIHLLNKNFLHHDYPTDVLSFPYQIPKKFKNTKFDQYFLGTILLCPDIIHKQEKSYIFDKYLVHGFFHLMGYDHISKKNNRKWQSTLKQYHSFIEPK